MLCGDVSLISVPHNFFISGKLLDIEQRASLVEALAFCNSHKISAVIFCTHSFSHDQLAFLSQIRFIQPQAPVLLIGSKIDLNLILDGVNRGQVFRFLKTPLAAGVLEESIKQAVERHLVFKNRTTLLKDSSSHNRELEALTNSLEAIVEERTRHVQESNTEQADKLAKERQLIRFITDLSAQNSFDDVLQTLRRDLKKFHHLGEPLLVYRSSAGKIRYWSFQSGVMRASEGQETFAFPKAVTVQDSQIMQFLANHFGRPFAKAVLLPLELKLMRISWDQAEAFLCFENSLSEIELNEFTDFIVERSEALGMVLDRLLLEESFETFSWRWEKTFDGMRDPIAIIDVDYNIVRANNKFGEKLLNRKCYSVFANRDSKCENCPAQSALSSGVPQTQTVQKAGKVFQVHSYPVNSGSERSVSVMHQYVDITQSRELYLRMLQSEKMGAIGMLAGNIAHELNNPLTGLKALTQVLLQETTDQKQLHMDLVEIEKAADRSQKIIKNLLEFSQGDIGVLEETFVDDLVHKTMPMLKTALRMHRLHLDLHCEKSAVSVEPHLIQQVIFNLVNNACQAMREVGDLTVRTGIEKNYAFVEIEDNGPGIPADLRARIFEPFFTTKQEGQGTGLGLSLAKSVVEKFSGRLLLKNVEPHGACFRIELPLVKPGGRKL